MAKATASVDKADNRPVVEKLLAGHRETANYSRSLIIQLSDGYDIRIVWEKSGEMMYDVLERSGQSMGYKFSKKHEYYELKYKGGKIESIVTPALLKEMEVDKTIKKGSPVPVGKSRKTKRTVKKSAGTKKRGRPAKRATKSD